MILVHDVHKRYHTDHGLGKWVLQGVNITFPRGVNVALVGRNGAGKSTLLHMISGIDEPTRGRIERRCSVSWPLGRARGLPNTLTGRQNARFVCRIHGHESDIPEKVAAVQDFSELGEAFDEPIYTYSSGMRSRLQFALSLAFEFDVYLVDETFAAGDAAFQKKAAAAFAERASRSNMIVVSHQEATLKQYCSAGVLIDSGQAYWFDKLDDALKSYKETLARA